MVWITSKIHKLSMNLLHGSDLEGRYSLAGIVTDSYVEKLRGASIEFNGHIVMEKRLKEQVNAKASVHFGSSCISCDHIDLRVEEIQFLQSFMPVGKDKTGTSEITIEIVASMHETLETLYENEFEVCDQTPISTHFRRVTREGQRGPGGYPLYYIIDGSLGPYEG